MFRRFSHRVSRPKHVQASSRELARARHVAEVRRSHPHLFRQPLQ